MWNTSFVYPSLMVLAILLIYYFARPRLPNRVNRAFLFLIIADIATIVTDLVSTGMDNHYELWPIPLVSAMNLLYFVAYIARIIVFFKLVLALLKVATGKRR